MPAMSSQRVVFYIIIVRCETSLLMTNGSMIFTFMLEFHRTNALISVPVGKTESVPKG